MLDAFRARNPVGDEARALINDAKDALEEDAAQSSGVTVNLV